MTHQYLCDMARPYNAIRTRTWRSVSQPTFGGETRAKPWAVTISSWRSQYPCAAERQETVTDWHKYREALTDLPTQINEIEAWTRALNASAQREQPQQKWRQKKIPRT